MSKSGHDSNKPDMRMRPGEVRNGVLADAWRQDRAMRGALLWYAGMYREPGKAD